AGRWSPASCFEPAVTAGPLSANPPPLQQLNPRPESPARAPEISTRSEPPRRLERTVVGEEGRSLRSLRPCGPPYARPHLCPRSVTPPAPAAPLRDAHGVPGAALDPRPDRVAGGRRLGPARHPRRRRPLRPAAVPDPDLRPAHPAAVLRRPVGGQLGHAGK